jgi:tetratricopeptide (TPR) repeat protein
MKRVLWVGAAVGIAALGIVALRQMQSAPALTNEQINACVSYDGAVAIDQKIGACTAAIQSGRWSGRELSWAFNNRGMGRYLEGDLDGAFADFEAAIRLDPNDAVALNNRGLARSAKGDIDGAIADYGAALRLDPTYTFALNHRATAYWAKGELDLAIADLTEAIRRDPDFETTRTFKPEGDLDPAATDHTKPFPAAPEIGTSLRQRGGVYFAKGDFDGAIADFTALLRLAPEDADLLTNRGAAYLAKGDTTPALRDLDEAIRLQPALALAWINRGGVREVMGDLARADADYAEAIRLAPEHHLAYLLRGVSRLAAGSFEDAIADLKQVRRLNPKDGLGALWLEIAERRSGLPSRLAGEVGGLDMTAWPAPIVRLFLGAAKLEAVLAEVNGKAAPARKGYACDAYSFAGQLASLEGQKDEAVRLYRLAAESCPARSRAMAVVSADLKALGATP